MHYSSRVVTYADFNVWLDVISDLNLIEAPAQMQFELTADELAKDAYTIDHVLTWLRAHVFGQVHHLEPEFPALEPHVLEFDDVLDAVAFRRIWGHLAD